MSILRSITKGVFARKPLSVFSKIVMVALLIITIFWTLLGVVVPANATLLIMAVVIFLLAALVATGIRWTPLLGSILGALILYTLLFKSAFPLDHLAHPKDAYNPWWLAYTIFIVIVILFWCVLMTMAAGVIAVIQNYWQRESHTPRWVSYALTGMIGVLLGAILLGAFAPTPINTATATASSNGEPAVHMQLTGFSQPSVTVSKGSKLLLIDDGNFVHNLSNGSWVNGQPQPESQSGAPTVRNLAINGKNAEIGPFTTAGTYHLYCSLHSGMMLTIVVQ